MMTRKPVIGKWVKVRDREGKEHMIVVSAGALIDTDGQVLGGFEMWRDAMPDAEAATRMHTLLMTMGDYSGRMNKLIDKLEGTLPVPVAKTIKTSMVVDEMRKEIEKLMRSCEDLLHAYCWSVKNCPPERQVQCPAFPNFGRNCWEIDYTWCDGQMQGKACEKTGKCLTCQVYKDFRIN